MNDAIKLQNEEKCALLSIFGDEFKDVKSKKNGKNRRKVSENRESDNESEPPPRKELTSEFVIHVVVGKLSSVMLDPLPEMRVDIKFMFPKYYPTKEYVLKV